jgi:hypothetical protein
LADGSKALNTQKQIPINVQAIYRRECILEVLFIVNNLQY